MAELVKQLVHKGYTVIAASNMITSTYESLVENNMLPVEFSDNFFFVATDPSNQRPDGKYYSKPAREYYLHLVQIRFKKTPRSIPVYYLYR